MILRLTADESTRETEDEQSNKDSDEVTVVKKRDDTIHDYPLDVVAVKRESKSDENNPSHCNDENSVTESEVTNRPFVTGTLRPNRLASSLDRLPYPLGLDTHRHLATP